MVSTSHRESGSGMHYAIGNQVTFGIYAVVMLVVSIITVATPKETKVRDLREDEAETARAVGAL